MKNIAVLGITGSIGLQTFEVIKELNNELRIIAISAGNNIDLLKEILDDYFVEMVCVRSGSDAYQLKQIYPKIEFVFGDEGLIKVATYSKADLVVNALVGFVGLRPTLAAIKAKKDVALANKETLVVGGRLVKDAIAEYKVKLLPIDSEHSAILQALQGNEHSSISKLIITASGGSFRDKTRDQLKEVSKEQALKHPNWSMGAKITIDSATMMNKGLEVIEAHWLFDVDFDDIEVIMHPESIIHSMVEFKDGAIIAQLGTPDMRIPIQYALCYPKRPYSKINSRLDITKVGSLIFKASDHHRFPLLRLAYEVGRLQGNLPTIMNAANEEAVSLFLADKIKFLQIEDLIMQACSEIPFVAEVDIEDIFYYDKIARQLVQQKGGY